MLNDSDIYNYWYDGGKLIGRENEKLYYIGDRAEGSSAIIPAGENWTNYQHPVSGKWPAFSKASGEEYEHLHPSEWVCYTPHCKGEVYRTQHDVHPFIGMTLAARILDAQTGLSVRPMMMGDAIWDHSDKWMDEEFETEEYDATGRTYREEMEYYQTFTIYYRNYGSGGIDFVDDMWSTYRSSY